MGANKTWTGGASDNNWSSGGLFGNWGTLVAAPTAGDSLSFAGSTRTTPNNDIAADTSFAGITFNSGAAAFTIGGNRITLGGNVTNNSTSVQTINLAMILSADRTFTTSASGGDLTIGGVLSETGGARGITKAGTGTLTLSGANTYTGATTVNAGTLSVSSLANGGTNSNIGASTNAATNLVLNGGTLQYTGAAISTDRLFSVGTSGGTLNASGTGAVNFTNTGSMGFNSQTGARTLTFTGTNTGNNTLAAVIGDNSGATSLSKSGTGTWILSGANTYTGATTVGAGILNIQNATALGTTAGGTSVTSGATLQIQGDITVGAEALTLNGSGASGQNGALVNVSGTNSYGGLITLGSASTISSDNGTLNLTNTGTITGATFGLTLTGAGNGTVSSIIGTTSGTLTKSGAGTWTLTGANTYTGATTISAGTLSVSSLANGGSSSNIGASTNAATKLVLNGGTLQYTGAAVSTDRLFSVGTSGGTLDASGTGAVNFTNTGSMAFNSQAGTRTLTLTGTNTGSNTLAAVIGDNGGATSLTKNGTGNWVLSGTNTYTGATTVNGGDLSTGTFTLSTTGTVSIASGATYTSTGTLNLNPDTTAAQTFVSGAGTLRLRNSSSTASAPDIYWNPTGSATSGAGYPVTIASNIDVGTGTRYINGISNRNDYERYGGDLVFSGNLTGSANLTFTGTPNTGIAGQTWQMAYTLAGNNSAFTGGIILTDGANLTLNNVNALTSANSVTFTPASGAVAGLYLYGRNITIGALSGTAAGTMNIRNGSLVTDNNTTINPGIVRSNSVLTVQQDTNTTFNGVISDGPNDHGSGDSGTYYTLGLVKTGTGSLTLGGTNTYTGGTTINGGALVVNSAASLGATSGGLTINAGTLEVATGYSTSRTITLGNASSTFQIDPSQTFTVTTAIGGSGALNKTGTGTMLLTASDSYSGGTAISNGILALGADSGGTENAGSLGSGAVTITGGGQLRFGGSSGAIVTYNISNNITLNNGSILVADGAQHLQGTFTVGSGGGTLTTQYSTKDLYFDGAVSGSGALVIDNLISPLYGDGQVHFTGSNSYSGTLTINNSSGSSDGGRIAVDSNNALANASIVMNGPRDIGFATTAPVFGALSGTGGITLTTGVNLSVGNNNTASTYSGVLTGPGSLTKIGTGTLTLSGANTYTGATAVSAGTLNVQNATALGTTAGGTTVSSGATLQLQGGITVGAEALTISGTGASGQNGALVNVSGTNNYGGLVTLGAASTISSDSGTLNLTNTGTITGATFGLTLTGSGNGSVSSIIGTTSGALTKSGSGTWTLSGANTYTGATTINTGTLKIDNAGSSAARLANTSGISVNSGGTLLLASSAGLSTDRINNSATVTVNGGGTFNTGGLSEGTRPSSSSSSDGAAGMGALTLASTSSGSHAIIDFGSTTAGSSLVFSSLSAASKGAFVDILNWGGTAWTDNGAATNDRLLFATDPGFNASDLANFAFSGYATGAVEITYGNLFEICPVPEPSTYVAGILTVSALFWNQRRRLFAVFRRNSK